jgi:hypothetical protein
LIPRISHKVKCNRFSRILCHLFLGSVWLKSQVERSRSAPVLLLFGYKVTKTKWLQLENILLRSGSIPLQKINRIKPLRSHPALTVTLCSVLDYQTQNRATPFLESGIEQLRSTWLLNQTLPNTTLVSSF